MLKPGGSCGRGLTRIAAVVVGLGVTGSALAISQSGEQKDMRRVGHTDLQGRPAYHPWFQKYPDGRVIAFIGTHGGSKPNTLKPGNPVEFNGTMIVDITNPEKPVEKFHIPAPATGAQTQSNRTCLGSDLPGGLPGHVYMMRNVQTNTLTVSGYEVWDVTNVTSPQLAGEMRNLRNTHKHWWECKTGIAYLPGSKALPRWRQGQSMMIVDWKTPSTPIYLRTHGLPGGQPSGVGPVPPSLHGAISAHEHPNAAGSLARPRPGMNDTIGNRIYSAWGVGDDGVLQVLDRQALLPPPYGTFIGNPDDPSNAELEAPQASILWMSPDQGGHTSFPVFGLKPKSYEDFTEFKTRDIVLLASESTADKCAEAPHWSFVVDVTVENSKSAPPGTRVQQNIWPDGALDNVGGSASGRKISAWQLLQTWRTLRGPLERGELHQSLLWPADFPCVLHRRRAGMGHPRATGSGRSRVLCAREQRADRDARRVHDQQPRGRRPRLHPGGGPQRRRVRHHRAARQSEEDRLGPR